MTHVSTQLWNWLMSTDYDRGLMAGEAIGQYWTRTKLLPDYEKISALALDVLSIIPTQVICEQLFSQTNRVLGNDKQHMGQGLENALLRGTGEREHLEGPEANQKSQALAITNFNPRARVGVKARKKQDAGTKVVTTSDKAYKQATVRPDVAKLNNKRKIRTVSKQKKIEKYKAVRSIRRKIAALERSNRTSGSSETR